MISNGKKHLKVGALGYLMKDCLPEELIKAMHRARLLEKMHMKINADLVGYALKHKLIE
jgi:DNA-binding NarL/FixJ family response regulator